MTPTKKHIKTISKDIVNPAVGEFLVEKYKPIDDDFLTFRMGCEERNIPIILPDCESFLLNLLKIKKPERILEIGTANGYSACCFAKSSGADVITIEKDADIAREARDNIKSLVLSKHISVITGDAATVLDNLDGGFDFVFIDAAKSAYREFFDKSVKLCNPGAVIACDNVLFKGMTADEALDYNNKHRTNIRNLREFLKYINNLENASTSVSAIGDGLSITVLD